MYFDLFFYPKSQTFFSGYYNYVYENETPNKDSAVLHLKKKNNIKKKKSQDRDNKIDFPYLFDLQHIIN